MKHNWMSIVVGPNFVPQARTSGEMCHALETLAPLPPQWLTVRCGSFRGGLYFNSRIGTIGLSILPGGRRTWL